MRNKASLCKLQAQSPAGMCNQQTEDLRHHVWKPGSGGAVKGPGSPNRGGLTQTALCSRLLCAVGQLEVRQLGPGEEYGSPAQAGCGPPITGLAPQGKGVD